ncbi:MAG: hypothetical protein ACYDCF_09220 [Burkholderiales bacterium]
MWDTEKSDDSTLPLYVAAAILEGQQWLQDQQYREGLTHADNHGWSWTLSARLAGRYFAVAHYPSQIFGAEAQDSLLILAYTAKRWNESREMMDIPSPEIVKNRLLWFATIPWRAHLSKYRDHLVLLCPEQPIPNGKSLPPWTLTLPVSLTAWLLMYADYRRCQDGTEASGKRQSSRFALGDGRFVPALGFDVEWGSLVDIPVRIDPLIREMKRLANTEIEPSFVKEASNV